MQKKNKDIPELIVKDMTIGVSPEEKIIIEQWKNACPENDSTYKTIVNENFIKEHYHAYQKIDVTKGYLKVLEKRQKIRVRRQIRIWSSVAVACVMLPLCILFLLSDRNDAPVISYNGNPGENIRAELILADGTKTLLSDYISDSVLTQHNVNIQIQSGNINYQKDSTLSELVYNTVRIPKGKQIKLALSEGTVIHLNSESELRFPVKFVTQERRVFLSGEAYFEVEKDTEKPFIVDLGKSTVNVLGTSFNVRNYQDENYIATTLTEGKVGVISDAGEAILTPGKQALINKDGAIVCKDVDTYLYTAWKEGVFAFQRMRLEDIMNTVSRWYNVNINWQHDSLKDIVFSGKMNRYENIAKVVKLLEITGNTKFKVEDNIIYIQEQP